MLEWTLERIRKYLGLEVMRLKDLFSFSFNSGYSPKSLLKYKPKNKERQLKKKKMGNGKETKRRC